MANPWVPLDKTDHDGIHDALCALGTTHKGSRRYRKYSIVSLRNLMNQKKCQIPNSTNTQTHQGGYIWKHNVNNMHAFAFLRRTRPKATPDKIQPSPDPAYCLTMTATTKGQYTAADTLKDLNNLCQSLATVEGLPMEILNDQTYPDTVGGVLYQSPTNDLTLLPIFEAALTPPPVTANNPNPKAFIAYMGAYSPTCPYCPDPPDDFDPTQQQIYRWALNPQDLT